MENTVFDYWVSSRIVFSNDDKRVCFSIITDIANISNEVRKYGLLSLEDKLPQIEPMFLREGLQLAVDSVCPKDIRKIMQNFIIGGDYRGKELLECILMTEGVVSIANGDEPQQIRGYLSSHLGVNFFAEYRKNYNDKIRKLFWEMVKNRQPYESTNLFEELIEKIDRKILGTLAYKYREDLVLSLRGSSETIINKIFAPWGEAEIPIPFMESMIDIKNPRLDDIQAAQNKILNIALDIAKELGINV